ncbi:MAG TPA: zinc ribbon domain-containing protein [Pyrinomonadaceae bacterium]|jgi:zinc-ribbon domain|nr:zinc ribbon domain-containing protein [Pyrinomonadaceae bacterium]
MFCPKCATQNLEGASFCRTCGANISLVPQALTGQLAPPPEEEITHRRGRRSHDKPSLDNAFKKIFVGFAFFIIAIALSRTMGQGWWFWLLIPAFSMMGQGVAQYIRLREKQRQASLAPPPLTQTFPEHPRTTEALRPPVPSVTEGTTRHLDPKERR